MFALVRLRYILNKEYFFSSSVVLKGISKTYQNLFFISYSVLKAFIIAAVILSLQVLIRQNDSTPFLFDAIQLGFFLICIFYYANISDSENSKTKIKDFLIGKQFNYREKIINRKKLSCLFLIEAVALSFFVWMLLLPLIKHVSLIKIIIYFILSIVSLVSVFFQNYQPKRKRGSKNWYIEYTLVGCIAFGFIYFWSYFKQGFNYFELEKVVIYLAVLGIIYQIINLALSFREKESKNQNIGGLTGDFIEKYVNKSAVIYFIPVVFFNIVTIHPLSKVLMIVAYISLFVMPNLVSLNFLNYYKMVGHSKNILIKYGQIILLFQVILALTIGSLCGISVIHLFFIVILLSGIMFPRILVAVLIVRSKHEDGKKADYYAISMFLPIILLSALGVFWR